MYVLKQEWLQDKGPVDPGLKICWPGWVRVSHIVTKGTKTYNAPVKNCPTKDNVMVEVDVSVTFQIGPTVEEATHFVYYLGAHRLDELLEAETQEAIRGLVHGVPAMRVHDLREEFALGMLKGLNKKVNSFGVTIQNVKITNVMLPPDMEQTLQRTTSYKTAMEQEEKKHQNNMRNLIDENALKLTTIRRQNERQVQDLVAAKQRALISREEDKVDILTKIEVAQTNATSKADTDFTKATSEKNVAFANGHNAATALKLKVRADCEALKVKAQQDALTAIQRSEAKLEIAVSQAQAKLAEARAEAVAAESLADQRSFELAEKRYAVLQALAAKGRMVISGETGENLLKTLVPGGVGDLTLNTGCSK